jgi:hypothetical protein
MVDINNVLVSLSHMNDLKVTYTNGFHVNSAITAVDRIFLDENSSWRDDSSFMRAAQPVIDEKALIPNQITLID